MKKRKLKERITLDPIMTLLILIVLTIVISGFLSLLGVQVTYNSITDSVTFDYTQSLVSVESLFSLSGLKYIFTTTVSNFVSFKPLSSLIIILIGIGVMEKSGFLKTFVTLLTKKAKKKTVTFVLVLICVLSSIMGEAATTKAGLIRIFANYKESKEEMDSIKDALKVARNAGYGIVYPTIRDMKLETPEIVKQGSRYGVKLKKVLGEENEEKKA